MSQDHEHPHYNDEKDAPQPAPVDWREHGVKVIRGDQLDTNTAQTPGMNRAAAINAARVGAQKIWAGTVTIHPNAKTGAHHHGALESVIYVVRGQARMRWGEHLEFTAEAGPAATSSSCRRMCRIRRSMRAPTIRSNACSCAATTKRSWSI
ncbi:quercetin dioxygenase-like cupin family protein [Burkholderia sp. OAS925]